VLVDPSAGSLFRDSLDAGDSAPASSFSPIGGLVIRTSTASGLPLQEFDVYAIRSELEGASRGLADAWGAVVASTAYNQKDWFPGDVPVLLAQIEGGEGKSSDSGLTLDSDRLLVRVVGYGGAR
jgi:hypothetical protein